MIKGCFAPAKRGKILMPSNTADMTSLEGLLQQQLVEIKAVRALLESMDRKLEAVYEITESKAISFARSEETP
jgi:hypothetical protein